MNPRTEMVLGYFKVIKIDNWIQQKPEYFITSPFCTPWISTSPFYASAMLKSKSQKSKPS
jgi:hypothetical protein